MILTVPVISEFVVHCPLSFFHSPDTACRAVDPQSTDQLLEEIQDLP